MDLCFERSTTQYRLRTGGDKVWHGNVDMTIHDTAGRDNYTVLCRETLLAFMVTFWYTT